MKYVLIFISLSFFTLLQATPHYPQLFSIQGTPLYTSVKNIATFKNVASLEVETSEYIQKLNDTQQIGFQADNSNNKTNKSLYLKALRSLQKSHDKILQHSIKELNYSMKKNDYQKFLNLVNAGMFYYKDKPVLKEKILTYYQHNKAKGKSTLLDTIIQQENSVVTRYAATNNYSVENTNIAVAKNSVPKKEIILLSRPGCPWCVKAKQLLQSTGNTYSEYNILQSEGERLYKKYNGTGVPIVIINEKVIKGFSKKAILSALK